MGYNLQSTKPDFIVSEKPTQKFKPLSYILGNGYNLGVSVCACWKGRKEKAGFLFITLLLFFPTPAFTPKNYNLEPLFLA